MIENLPVLTPDTSRSANTLARCHRRLAGRRRKIEARRRVTGRQIVAERLVVAAFCVAYFIAMAGDLVALATRR
jgi:hypothetical protein